MTTYQVVCRNYLGIIIKKAFLNEFSTDALIRFPSSFVVTKTLEVI